MGSLGVLPWKDVPEVPKSAEKGGQSGCMDPPNLEKPDAHDVAILATITDKTGSTLFSDVSEMNRS